jgi:hypothetical protein
VGEQTLRDTTTSRKDYVRSPRQYYPDHEIIPIKEVVASKWREFAVEEDDDGAEKVNRLNPDLPA